MTKSNKTVLTVLHKLTTTSSDDMQNENISQLRKHILETATEDTTAIFHIDGYLDAYICVEVRMFAKSVSVSFDTSGSDVFPGRLMHDRNDITERVLRQTLTRLKRQKSAARMNTNKKGN